MTTFKKIIPAALCAAVLAGAAVPASAEPFHGGWGHPGGGWGRGGWDHHGWGHRGWGYGPALAFGGIGLATGAALASYERPVVVTGPVCGETISTHYNAYGERVKVIRQNPC